MQRTDRLLFLFLLVFTVITARAQPRMMVNPVLPGFNPDPSICRAGDDYYMTTSSFTWYPGLPVYHSRDLVHWELMGHALNRPGMVDMNGLNDNDGTWAATIRYHKGIFYIITTASKCGGNFYVTATDPRGPWSDPVWLKDAPGIDPSLFFDDDGRCYYTGNSWDFKHQWRGQCGVWVQELDLGRGRLVGERRLISYGHAANAMYAEGPHLYKHNGRYVLLMAEGGSAGNHAVTVMQADSVFGPYTPDQINPVLTHRHLGRTYPVRNIGHADIVDTPQGEWYAVVLGNRYTASGNLSTLGRETFLCRVDWEGSTPIFNRGYGKVRDTMEVPQLPWTPLQTYGGSDSFDGDSLTPGWYTLRTPRHGMPQVKNGQLLLPLRAEVLDSLTSPSLLMRKLTAMKAEASTRLFFHTRKDNEQAGMVLYRSAGGYYTLTRTRKGLELVQKLKGRKQLVATAAYDRKEVWLKITVDGPQAVFAYSSDGHDWQVLGGPQTMAAVADDGRYNKFNGTGIGLYASAGGKHSDNVARYDFFQYENR